MPHPILTGFNAGEWSPRMNGRVDLQKYPYACSKLENFIILPQGGATARPGFRYVAPTKYSTKRGRLVPFIYSNSQAYVLLFEDGYVSFFADRGQVVTGSPPHAYRVQIPYSETDLPDLKFKQSGDVLWIVHPDHSVRKLSRYDHTDWQMTSVNFTDGPWLSENIIGTTITPSGTTGTITLTADDDVFVISMANAGIDRGYGVDYGTYFRLRHNGGKVRKKMTAVDQTTDVLTLRGKFSVNFSPVTPSSGGSYWDGRVTLQASYDDGSTWYDIADFLQSTLQDFFETKMDVQYRAICKEHDAGAARITISQTEQWGVVQIMDVTNARTASGQVIIPLGATTATSEWRESAFSNYRGFPRAIEMKGNRLLFAGTANQPAHLWGTWVGDYSNMTPGDTDDSPLDFDMTETTNAIQWLMNHNYLIAGTVGCELSITGGNDNPITPSNVQVNVVGKQGSANSVSPIKIDRALLFLQLARRRLLEMTFQFMYNTFSAPDLTMTAEHITESGIVEMDYQMNPDSVVWCLRNDGVLAGMTYYRLEDVVGWHRHITDGAFESVCVVPSTISGAEGHDEVWVIVNRTVNGSTVRYVEYLEDSAPQDDLKDYFRVDCGLTYSGAAATTITGLSHIEGKAVAVLADGLVVPGLTVSGGAITLPRPAGTVHVGLPFTSTLQTMNLEAATQDGTNQGRVKSFGNVTLRLLNTAGGKFGPDETGAMPLRYWVGDEFYLGEAYGPYSGDVTLQWPGESGKAGKLCLVQSDPLPMTVTAIMPLVRVGNA